MTDYGSLYDEPCDELTAAERRALFYVRRLCIDQGRMVAGVWVYRRANRSYRVGGVPSPVNQTVGALQLWAAREVLRQAGEVAA